MITRNSLVLAVAHGATKIFSIALTAVAARVLGASGYGLYALGSALVEVARIVAAGGLDFIVAREVAAKPERASRVAANAAVLKVIAGTLAYAAVIAAALLLDYPRPVLFVAIILGSAVYLENLSDIIDAVFQGRERMEYTARAFILGAAFHFVGGVAALMGGLGLYGYCAAFVLGFVVRFVCVHFFGVRQGFLRLDAREIDRSELRSLARAGAPLLGGMIVGLLFHRIDILMLGKMVSDSDVGLYGAAVRIIDVVVLAPRIMATAAYPAMTRTLEGDEPQLLPQLMAKSVRLSFAFCSGIAILIWLLAPFTLRWVTGSEFVPATLTLRLLSWGIVLQAGSHMYGRLLVAMERERDFLTIALWSLAANVLLNLALIPRMGIDGAAWATLLSYALNLSLYHFYAARRGVRVSVRRSSLSPALALLAALFISYLIDAVYVRAAAMIVAWFAVSLLSGAFQMSDLTRIVVLLRDRLR